MTGNEFSLAIFPSQARHGAPASRLYIEFLENACYIAKKHTYFFAIDRNKDIHSSPKTEQGQANKYWNLERKENPWKNKDSLKKKHISPIRNNNFLFFSDSQDCDFLDKCTWKNWTGTKVLWKMWFSQFFKFPTFEDHNVPFTN